MQGPRKAEDEVEPGGPGPAFGLRFPRQRQGAEEHDRKGCLDVRRGRGKAGRPRAPGGRRATAAQKGRGQVQKGIHKEGPGHGGWEPGQGGTHARGKQTTLEPAPEEHGRPEGGIEMPISVSLMRKLDRIDPELKEILLDLAEEMERMVTVYRCPKL